MRRHAIAASVVICLGLVVLTGLFAQNQVSPAPADGAVRWEHMALATDTTSGISNPEISRQIIKLGNEGWELVDVENFHQEGTTKKTVYFFKRPR